MLKIYPQAVNEYKKIKKNDIYDIKTSNKFEVYLLINESNYINLLEKMSEKINNNTKCYKILDKSPFYILKIDNNIYLVKEERIKEVKKYLYKKKENKNIFLSNVISPNIKSKAFYMLNEGLQIDSLELLNVKDINSIEEFKILKINPKQEEIKNNKNKNPIKIKSEKEFLEVKNEIEFFIKNNNYFKIDNDINVLLSSLFSIEKEKREKYFYSTYSKLKIINNYIEIKENKIKEYVNLKKIIKITIQEKEKEIEFTDPLGKEYYFKFYILEVNIYVKGNDPMLFYCFENDFKQNEFFKVNKNKFLKEI